MSAVQVAVRARPLSQREIDLQSPLAVEMRDKSTILMKTVDGLTAGETRDRSTEFVYDHSYWSVDPRDDHFTSQEKVYHDLGTAVLEAAFEGYNVCVFAYGQTGSGKTYTMMGQEGAVGLIPRICQTLFSRIAAGTQKGASYRTEASYMEIYNEKVRDLLLTETSNSHYNLRVREHPTNGPYVENLSQHFIPDYPAVQHLINRGNSHRTTAATKMNDSSSRSHAIFTITFTQAMYSPDAPSETRSRINLVDLAGSERAAATGAEGIRLKEGGSINKSLVCLGIVISSLADLSSHSGRQKKAYIPYRDSVLTWLLKDSLGGNSKTIMIATISPAVANYGETLSTLRYASRAKNIVNKPVVNEDTNVKLIRELRAEIRRLKSVITTMQGTGTIPNRGRTESIKLVADIHKKEEQVAELTRTWAGRWTGMESIAEEGSVAVHTEGIKMTLESELPHFLALGDGSFGAGIVLYKLQNGATTVGSVNASPKADIELSAPDIEPLHCMVEYADENVLFHPREGKCYVNGNDVSSSQSLHHGNMVQLGSFTLFQFMHPTEAQELKQQHRTSGTAATLQITPLQSPQTSSRTTHEHSTPTGTGSEMKEDCATNLDAATEEGAEATRNKRRPSSTLQSPPAASELDVDFYSEYCIVEYPSLPDRSCHLAELSCPVVTTDANRSAPVLIRSNAVSQKEDDVFASEIPLASSLGRFGGYRGNTWQDQEQSHILRRKLGLEKDTFDDLDGIPRSRSNALGEKELRPKPKFQMRRTKSASHLTTIFKVEVPRFFLRGKGFTSYHLYEVKIRLGEDKWYVYRRYKQFQEFHDEMKGRYPELSALSLPPSKWFGYRTEHFVQRRRQDLERYLQSFLAICTSISTCPLSEIRHRKLTKLDLAKFSPFFSPGSLEANVS